MSTRAAIRCDTLNGDPIYIYTHHDGYPEGVGALVLELGDWMRGEAPLPYATGEDFDPFRRVPPNTLGEPGKLAAVVLGHLWARGYTSAYITNHWDRHGDLEYRYELTVRGQPGQLDISTRCYARCFMMGWDRLGYSLDLKRPKRNVYAQ